MAKFVYPRVFLIAQTEIDYPGLANALEAIGAPDWKTAAESAAEILTEFAGKSCYLSFDKSLNENLTVTGTRTNYDYIQDGIIKTGHGCYDGETEVLTADGWKFFADVTMTDRFATRTSAGELQYCLCEGIVAAPYRGTMYRVKARGVDLLVTPNHTMLVCKTTTRTGRRKEDYELITASNLRHVSHAYVKTALWNAPKAVWNDSVFALLGFAIGDAYGTGRQLHFHLRKERKIAYLKNLCASLGWKLTEKSERDAYVVHVPTTHDVVFRNMYTSDREKQIPQGMLLSISKAQAEKLYEGLMQADGHVGSTSNSFDTTSQVLADQMQQLCLHIGLAANVCYTYDSEQRLASFGSKPLTRLSIIRRELKPEVNKFVDGVGKTSWVHDWGGDVYCVQVPNNTLYVRRNGIPVWCGNSVLEHSTVSFFLVNVSRVLTHELVRHRPGTAYSQTSGRYVRDSKVDMYFPEILNQADEAEADAYEAVFLRAMDQMEENLAKLVEISGINNMKDFTRKKKLTSAFRRILGNGCTNHILVTANHRAWRSMIEARTSEHAEEEIRSVFLNIFHQLKHRFPAIYADMHIDATGGVSTPNKKV